MQELIEQVKRLAEAQKSGEQVSFYSHLRSGVSCEADRADFVALLAHMQAQQAVVDAARAMKFARERFSELQADVHPDKWGAALGALRSTESDVYAALDAALEKVKP